MVLIDLIKEKRPNICDNTVKAYDKQLTKIYSNLGNKGIPKNTKYLQNFGKIEEYIDGHDKITTKKNKLTAIIVAIDADKNFKGKDELKDKYQKKLKELNDEYNDFLKKQIKTPTQEKNWIEYSDMVDIANDLVKKVKGFKTKEKLEKHEFEELQNAILLKSHLEFPIRNDLSEVKVIDLEKYEKLNEKEQNKHNWLIKYPKSKMVFVLNNFKNSKKIGTKKYDVPKNLINLYKIWFRFNKSEYFLVSKRDRMLPINGNTQTKYFNSLFHKYYPEKNISSSLIRHIVISHFSENQPTIEELEKKAQAIEDKYLHSASMNAKYRKIDKKVKKVKKD
tara:strand:+ start:6005 stop:7009 length:1005 start_codon:yes stop_codon:yes gene_type:complete